MELIKVIIDNKVVEVESGTTILKAAKKINIDIPTLCYFELGGMKIENKPGGCRVCLVEIEGRKKLNKRFTLQANGSYINSKIDDASLNISRSLQGQSPYIVNTGLLYDVVEKGFNATLLFNQVGKRIYLVGDIQAGAGTPDVYENPRSLIDFQVSKKFAKNKAEIKLTISDLLNQRQIFYQNNNSNTDYNTTTDAIRLSRKFGTTYGVTLNYSL
jgi:ferredoxin